MKLSLRSFLTQAALVLGGGIALSSCIQRPLGTDQPKTTNVIVDNLKQSSVDKIDMLFVIDNSLSMGDKQVLMAEALPDLVDRLVDPVCINDDDETADPVGGQCPQGYAREFQPINNIHIGVVTSSLGGFGARTDCTNAEEGDTDNAHLLGSLPRVQAQIPGTPPFLSWCLPGSDSAVNMDCTPTPETHDGNAELFSADFADQVRAANEFGCGWEATLEAWYRFLIEPYPWTKVVRQDCPFGGDMNQLCVGPEKDATGVPYLDQTILDQRKQFLRADSLLAIVMLTDENDCSFKASGQSWRLSESRSPTADPDVTVANKAYKGSTACQADPNGPCCVSCGTTTIPSGCPTGMKDDGTPVNAGCEEPRYLSQDELNNAGSAEPTEDAVNLRCFNHKQRFGVDYLYPVERYSNALKFQDICPYAETLDPLAVNANGERICGDDQVVQNPLYIDLSYADRLVADPAATPVVPRSEDLVFLAGIVGVPWQDLAVDPDAPVLEYKTNRQSAIPGEEMATIDWVQLLGNAAVGANYDLLNAPPADPLMREQIEKRTGTNPAINGGEWNVLERDDLQYACIFPLDTPVMCPDDGAETVPCDCTYYGGAEYENPLCDDAEPLRQTHAKAYPSIRPLQVLRDFGANSIVASICPKETSNVMAADFGYRPAVAAIVDRLKEQLKDKCLSRKLEVKEVEGGRQANCLIIEANTSSATCNANEARGQVETEEIKKKVWERLERTGVCEDVNGDCQRYNLCQILPIAPGTADYESCLSSDNPSGDGWCYVDPDQNLGDPDQVAKCPETERRKIRFAGAAAPKKGTVTFFACAGAPEGVSAEPAGGGAGAGAM